VWVDNLFSSERLFTTLRDLGIGAAGTVRTTITAREEKIKKEEAQDAVEDTCKDSKVLQFLWMDSSPVLFMLTIDDASGSTIRLYQRPNNSTARVRALWGDQFTKLLNIPTIIDDYNYSMNGVDRA
ncbi:hypothetical protein K469DRAFT_540770, partial [Zopfia rhizophila CBS 207.26]